MVLDTNVLVASAFRPGSDSGRLVEAIRKGRVRLVWDGGTRNEAEHLFRRIPPIARNSIERLYRPEGQVGDVPTQRNFLEVPDPADRKFASLAYRSGSLLVSMDADLLRADLRGAPLVLPPKAAIQYLGLGGGRES